MKKYLLFRNFNLIFLCGPRDHKHFGRTVVLGVKSLLKEEYCNILGQYFYLSDSPSYFKGGFSLETVEFESDEDAILWFKLKYPEAEVLISERI